MSNLNRMAMVAVVGEVTPGISLHGEGGRVKANLDYQMQNVMIQDKNDTSYSTYNQLNSSATAELSKDLLFVDASANAGQAVIDANRSISVGNLNTSN